MAVYVWGGGVGSGVGGKGFGRGRRDPTMHGFNYCKQLISDSFALSRSEYVRVNTHSYME